MPSEKSKIKFPRDVYESYLELSDDCIAIYSLEGILEYCNPANLEVFGYGPDELCGFSIREMPFLKKEQVEVVAGLFQELKDSENLDPVELQVRRKDGQEIWVEVNTTLLKRDNKPFAIQSVTRDITERKKMEEESQIHLQLEKIVSRISGSFIGMPDEQIDRGIEDSLGEISEFIGAVRAWMVVLSEDGTSFYSIHEWKRESIPADPVSLSDIPFKQFEYSMNILKKHRDVLIRQQEDLPAGAKGEQKWFQSHAFRPFFFVPIISEDALAGAVGFAGERESFLNWQENFSNLLRYVGSLLFSAIQRRDLSRNLRLTRFTLETYSESVYWLTSDASLIDVNPGACRSLGYSREELLKMHVYDFDSTYPVDNQAEFWNRLKEMGSNTLESIHTRKNGESFPVEINANFLEFEDLEYVVAFARDITERKKAEDAIRTSEQEFRKIFENVVDVFYEASLDGIMINVTPSVERLTKYTREELIGQPMVVFYYDQSAREPLLRELHEKGFVSNFEIEVRDKDGAPISANLSSRIIYDEEGAPVSIVGSISDMTHRKLAEVQVRQLSTALEQSPVPVIITDTDAKILYVNNSFVKFSEMKPRNLIGKTPQEITRGQISSWDEDIWESVKDGNIFREEIEYMNRRKRKLWISVTISPVFDENKKISHFVAVLEDITERKKYEESLKKSRDKAEESDRLKSAFLANMSHEIRTPMNAILGFSSLLKEHKSTPEQQAYYIDIINSKGRDLLRIISDIIDISRIEAGDLYIKMEPIEVFKFIRKIYQEHKEDAQLKTRSNLQFRLNIPTEEKRVIINTDATRLKQVFVNLIQNAIKFTPEGYIEMGFELQEDNNILMFVKDSGIGISVEKQELIFDRFRQIDDSHTREYGGTGLGLAICMNLVERMGGQLSVRSAEGQGSEFHFTLKYILTQKPGPDVEKDQLETGLSEVKLDLTGKRILVVEDDSSSFLLLETLLKKYNPDISWAKNGQQALSSLKTEKPFDMILMDIRMPEMNGLEATVEIRKKHPKIPVIAQTAYAQVTDRKMALEKGCNDYISKPINPLELKSILVRYLLAENPS